MSSPRGSRSRSESGAAGVADVTLTIISMMGPRLQRERERDGRSAFRRFGLASGVHGLVFDRGAQAFDCGEATALQLVQRRRRCRDDQGLALALPDVKRQGKLQQIADGAAARWSQARNPS